MLTCPIQLPAQKVRFAGALSIPPPRARQLLSQAPLGRAVMLCFLVIHCTLCEIMSFFMLRLVVLPSASVFRIVPTRRRLSEGAGGSGKKFFARPSSAAGTHTRFLFVHSSQVRYLVHIMRELSLWPSYFAGALKIHQRAPLLPEPKLPCMQRILAAEAIIIRLLSLCIYGRSSIRLPLDPIQVLHFFDDDRMLRRRLCLRSRISS